LEEALARRIEDAADDDVVGVSIWAPMQAKAALPDNDREAPTRERPAAERELDTEVERAMEGLIRHLERHDISDVRPFGAAPMVEVEVSVAKLRELARSDQVGAVFLRDEEVVLDLGNSIAIARSDQAQLLGFDGTDINVAVWENGPDVLTDLDIEDRFSASPATSAHSRLTHAIIKNVEPNRPHGHAPDCNLFSANTMGTGALRWAVEPEQACTVISQSFHRISEAQNGTLQGDDVLKDWLVLRWPFPTILQAAGNFFSGDPDGVTPPEDEFVNHKGFNSMNLANHDDTAGAIAGGSTFNNPTSAHGDRELPELAAVDARDGAGAVNAQESVRIAQQQRFRNAPATRRGWDVGTFRSADVGSNRLATFRYHVSVPLLLLSPTVKVALAWDSKVTSSGTSPLSSELTVDLDLLIFDGGNLVAQSSSFDNSYEVAEFAAARGATYDIVIRRWSGTDDVWYGVAWNVVGTAIELMPLDSLERTNGSRD
jgi:hypothetical protein